MSSASRLMSAAVGVFMRPIKHHVYNNCQRAVYQHFVESAENPQMSRTTSATQHEATKRIYDAALERKLIAPESQLTGLAAALGMTLQLVKNWDSRGPSQRGLNLVQARLGINSTWVRTGS